MAEIIRMPKLSDTMTEGVVAEWHKKVGDNVAENDLLADIETDKATMEFESYSDGTLLYIGIEKGQTAPVDSILAIIGDKGEEFQSLIDNDTTPEAAIELSAPVSDMPKEAPVSSPSPVPEAVPVAAPVVTPIVNDGQFKASPLAKKLANERGIDLSTVNPTGDNGRIVKADIDNYRAPAANSYNGSMASAPAIAGQESFTEVPVSQMRKTIARRLSESKFTAPHFYLSIEVDMDNVITARKAVNAAQDVKVSFNDFVVKADAAIMAIGGIIEKPIVKNGQIVPGHRMKVTLSCDHRVVDGAMGSEFLNTFKAMLEEPVLMMA